MAFSSSVHAQNPPFQLEEASISSVHQAMQNHQLTCVQLVKDYLNRIKTYDLDLSRGAPINAFVNINPEVLSEAQVLDQAYAETGHFVGPLHCIPMRHLQNSSNEWIY